MACSSREQGRIDEAAWRDRSSRIGSMAVEWKPYATWRSLFLTPLLLQTSENWSRASSGPATTESWRLFSHATPSV